MNVKMFVSKLLKLTLSLIISYVDFDRHLNPRKGNVALRHGVTLVMLIPAGTESLSPRQTMRNENATTLRFVLTIFKYYTVPRRRIAIIYFLHMQPLKVTAGSKVKEESTFQDKHRGRYDTDTYR